MKEGTEKSNSNHISTKSLLDNTDFDDLKLFVKGYAAQEQKFGLLLKTHFINTCSSSEIGPLTLQILSSIVKPIQQENEKISRSKFLLFLKVSKELLVQADDKLSLEQYQDAFEISRITIDMTCYIIGAYHQTDKRIQLQYDLLHQHLSNLLSRDIAPELGQKILTFLILLHDKSYYTYGFYSIIDIIERMKIHDAATIIAIHESITNKIVKDNNGLVLTNYLRTSSLNSSKIDSSIISLFDIEQIKMSYMSLYQTDHFQAIRHSIQDITNKGIYAQHFDEILINTAEVLKENQKLKQLLYDAFLTYQDFRYFDKLKGINTKPQWNKYSKRFKTFLVNRNDTHLLAQFLKKENELGELAALLQKEKKWDLIKDFSFYLYEKDKHKLSLTYQYYGNHILSYYEEDHIPNIKNIFAFIEQNHDKQMLKKVTSYLEKKHPDTLK